MFFSGSRCPLNLDIGSGGIAQSPSILYSVCCLARIRIRKAPDHTQRGEHDQVNYADAPQEIPGLSEALLEIAIAQLSCCNSFRCSITGKPLDQQASD